jgi:hypothetical protein
MLRNPCLFKRRAKPVAMIQLGGLTVFEAENW